MQIMNFDFNAGDKQVKAGLEEIVNRYKNYDVELDKKVFKALLVKYRCSVDTAFLPDIYKDIKKNYSSESVFVDSLYAKSQLKSLRGLQRFLNRDSTYDIMKDPAILLSTDFAVKFLEMGYKIYKPSMIISKDERELTAAIRRMDYDKHSYPDANSTMRMSYGTICSYYSQDGMKKDYYTTSQSLLDKVKSHKGDHVEAMAETSISSCEDIRTWRENIRTKR